MGADFGQSMTPSFQSPSIPVPLTPLLRSGPPPGTLPSRLHAAGLLLHLWAELGIIPLRMEALLDFALPVRKRGKRGNLPCRRLPRNGGRTAKRPVPAQEILVKWP